MRQQNWKEIEGDREKLKGNEYPSVSVTDSETLRREMRNMIIRDGWSRIGLGDIWGRSIRNG